MKTMRTLTIILCLALIGTLSGCALFQPQKSNVDSNLQPRQEGPNQVFYGFPDIPIPNEVSMVNDRSFVYETSGLKSGVLSFTGNVDVQSLENYFKVNMPKNGWRYLNSFRYKDILMNYIKDDRTCTIKISRGVMLSDLELWVGQIDKSSQHKTTAGDPIK